MSGDPEQEYFADGMVEDIITALSRFKSLFVIARNSSFTYKGNAVDIKQVGRELGVRYVLEGSVRKAGGRVRITGQLIEAATNRHLWADKFDGVLQEVFELQDQVTSAVIARLLPSLEEAERERALGKPTADLNSYDLFLRGGAVHHNDPIQALGLFKKAIEGDPKFAGAYAAVAATHVSMQSRGLGLDPDAKTEAIEFAREGARLGTNDAYSLARAGHALAYIGREYDLGLSLVDRAIALNPNLGVAQMLHGHTCVLCSEFESAVESHDRIMRLSPLDPLMPYILCGRSFALAGLFRYEEGYADAVRSLQSFVDAQGLGALIANAVGSGRSREAKEAASRLLEMLPGFSISAAANAFHTKDPKMLRRLFEHYRIAGLPE
jgi:TolB-like protein